MSTFSVTIIINDRPFDLIADTGASITTLPKSITDSLEIVPIAVKQFRIATGETVTRSIGQARFRFPDRPEEYVSQVCISAEGAPLLLGSTTLATFFLAVDPRGKCLIEIPDAYLCLGEVLGYARIKGA